MKIADTTILTQAVEAGTNIVSFADIQLDNIYKKYGSSSNLTATFILTTANKYTNSKTCTINFTGNQKTIHIGKSGVKRGKVYICVNGQIKKAVFWVGSNSNIARRTI